MFRIEKFNNKSITEIQFLFSEDISTSVGIANIDITFNVGSQSLSVKAVEVDGRVLTITVAPQRPLINYKVEFVDTDDVVFANSSGSALQSGKVFFFIGQEQ
jgi:hypothetical protein